MTVLERFLAHPLTRGLDLDAPETTTLRREIILSKPFLRQVYLDWYRRIASRVPEGPGRIVEIGAGGGFLEEVLPEVITSEVFTVPGIGMVADARTLPIRTGALRALVMTNVFHHIPDVASFIGEAERALRPGGRVIMVEPWNTWWSRFVHERFHDEPMLPETPTWEFPATGPVSGANAALAWVVASRDRGRLEREWKFRVTETEPFMPLRYIVSGGISMRSMQPGWMYPFWVAVDRIRPLKQKQAVFAFVVLERTV